MVWVDLREYHTIFRASIYTRQSRGLLEGSGHSDCTKTFCDKIAVVPWPLGLGNSGRPSQISCVQSLTLVTSVSFLKVNILVCVMMVMGRFIQGSSWVTKLGLWSAVDGTQSVSGLPDIVSVPTITGSVSWESGISVSALGGAWGVEMSASNQVFVIS